MPWSPLPEPQPHGVADGEADGTALHLTVDGEDFEVRPAPQPGTYHYAWTSGPNPGYGFTSARSDGRPSTIEEHCAAIRDFLAQVDPATGHIE